MSSCELTCGSEKAPIKLDHDSASMRVLVDRSSIEVFLDNGACAVAINMEPENGSKGFEVFAIGLETSVHNITIYEMKSIWV